MKESKLDEYYCRLGMTNDMRKQIEDWRSLNRDEETGKIPSFVSAIRQLVDKGLGHDKTKD
jgi:hypothetical protein